MNRSAPTVLVVEDHVELRQALCDALAAEGYEILAAGDETEALDILREKSVNLLITDLASRPDARQTLDTVRVEFPELPVVALSETTWYSPPSFQVRQRRGGVRTISKPFRLGELLAVSREVLDPADQGGSR